jgi:hypothetical protein
MKRNPLLFITAVIAAILALSGMVSRAEDKVTLKLVRVDSEETAGEAAGGANAVDGDPATFWHTQWQDASPACPHEIVIELMPSAKIKGFNCLPRQDDSENGMIKDYEFYVSDDGKEFGRPVKTGTFGPGKEKKTVTFEARTCRFIKLRALSEINGEAWTSIAEMEVVQAGGETGSQSVSVETPAAALKHRYSFTADASDSVGHADGTLEGAAGISGGQVRLNGTRGTYVNLPGGLVAGCRAVTFEFWVTLGANKSWARVFDQGSTNGDQGGHDLYFCPHSGAKDFRLTIMDPHPTERLVTVPGNLDHQTNLHVACVLDPPSGFMGIYTNGVLAAARHGLASLSSVDTNVFFLGRSLFASDAPLNGSIDEFRIYSTALSATAIAASCRNGPNAVFPAP